MKPKQHIGWAVAWTEKARIEYGVPKNEKILSVEPVSDHGKRYKSEGIYIDVLTIFPTKKWAECYKKNNEDFKVIKVKITT